ncbi:MAG: hypothetical protein HKN13_00370, partial [Rhodothermales bacterium]|nr:hypothetical protein [Rhodothermales bacterium]
MSSRFTNAQKLIWSGQVMHPGSPLYNMIHVFRIDGVIDPVLFETAVSAVVRASDILNSALVTDGDGARLVGSSARKFYEYVDLSAEHNTEAALVDWLGQRKTSELKLEDSLIDCVLIRLSSSSSAFYFNTHHLAMDAWATGLFFRLVGDSYQNALDGTADEPTVLPYEALIEFEEKLVGTARYDAAASFWDSTVAASFQTPNLYGRETSIQTTSSVRRKLRLGSERVSRLRALSEYDEVKGFTEELAFHAVLLSVLGVFVSRVSGVTDFAISMPTANRLTPRFRNTIGSFAELFPVLLSIDPAKSFLDTVADIRSRSAESFRHALPGLGRPELNRRSSVVLNYVNASIGSFAGRKVETEWIHSDHFDSNHLVRLHAHDFDQTGDLTLLFDFAGDAFSKEMQDDAMEQFLMLFDAFVLDPTQPVGKPSLVKDRDLPEGAP